MRYIFILTLFALIACNSNDKNAGTDAAAGQEQTTVTDSTSFTSLEWIDSVNTQLGKIREGQVVEVSWRFRNTGNKPLIIQDVNPGCGCTIADRPDKPIAPGEEGRIIAKFDSKGQGPNFTKSVTVKANVQDKPTQYLSFSGEVIK